MLLGVPHLTEGYTRHWRSPEDGGAILDLGTLGVNIQGLSRLATLLSLWLEPPGGSRSRLAMAMRQVPLGLVAHQLSAYRRDRSVRSVPSTKWHLLMRPVCESRIHGSSIPFLIYIPSECLGQARQPVGQDTGRGKEAVC